MVIFLTIFSFFTSTSGLKVRDQITTLNGLEPSQNESQFNEDLVQTLSMASNNVTEWNEISFSGGFVGASQNVAPICVEGHAIPELYLLGAQRAGTTTMASDLIRAGVKSAHYNVKELHHFDFHCGFKAENKRANRPWRAKNYAKAEQIPVCQKIGATEKSNWARWYSKSCVEQPPLADMTPANLRIPGLAHVIADLYAQHSSRLSFAILVREPLARFQSGWYHAQEFLLGMKPPMGAFGQYVKEMIPLARELKNNGSIGRSYAVDELYRSMYSLNIKPWLETFDASRFIIIASRSYQSNLTFKKHTLRAVGDLLGSRLSSDFIKLEHANNHYHPRLDADLDAEIQLTLRTEFFDSSVTHFARMLAKGIPRGLILAGFDKVSATTNQVKQFLVSNW